MVKTFVSILVALALVLGVSAYEFYSVEHAFDTFRTALISLYKKTEREEASHEDGVVVREVWQKQRRTLNFWLPHTELETIDYQLNEALGYLYTGGYPDALPKLELLIDFTQTLPQMYQVTFETIF